MSFNQVENALLADAIQMLEAPYRRLNPEFKGRFYLGSTATFMVIEEGEHAGKLTIAKCKDYDPNSFEPDARFEPVPCYDRMLPDECIATAVKRIYG